MSVDNSCSYSLSNEDVAGHLADERPKLFESIGSAVVSLTCYVLRKSRNLPYLVGPMIGAVEDIVSPHIQPLADKAGTEGLYLLSLADVKLYEVGETAMEKFVINSSGVHSLFEQVTTVTSYAYEQVCERGMLCGAANTWVKYEVTVKSKSADTLKFIHRLPLLGTFVPVIYTVGTPIASAISNWLVKHSEAQERLLVFHEVRLLDDDTDMKDSSEGKHLFVVDNGIGDSSRMDAQKSSSEIDSTDRSLNPESSETVKMSDFFEEVGEPKAADDGTVDKGKSTVMTVAPVSTNEDSDDELSALFHEGWSVGKISPSRKISTDSKARQGGWW